MPRLPKSTVCATAALLCASLLLAQPFDTSSAQRTGRAPETPRNANHAATSASATPDFGRLPLTFEANRGQAAPRVEYLARGAGYTLKLARDGALLSLKSRDANGARAAQLRMSFPGAAAGARPAGLGLTETVSNYFMGSDPRRWVTGVENYARVAYAGLYEGVDLVFHGTGGQVEYDFSLSPGADARRVKVKFDGVERASVGTDGALVLSTRAGEVRQPKPFAYQEDGAGRRTRVECDYVLGRRGEVGFRLGAYDQARALVIDPVLVYSTYLGATVSASDIAVDAAGNAYVVGNDITGDALVQKLNPTGTALVYSTHVGGSSDESAYAVALDSGGNAYVTGSTTSTNFPTSSDAFDKTCGNNGTCNDLGQGTFTDGFVFKLNPAGDALVYSTYLGGSGVEPIPSQTNWPMAPKLDIAVDAGGDAYVTGSTTSQDFPTTAGAFRTTPATSFVTRLNPAGTALVYSTYFPGAIAQSIAVSATGVAHITGMTTTSDSNPPTLPVVNAYQPTLGGQFTFDAFVAKLNASGSALVFSTFLGGPEGSGDTPRGGDDYGNGVGIDSTGNVYVTGATRSGCFPVANPYVPPSGCASGGGFKQFLVKLNPAGDTLLFSKKLTTFASTGGGLSVDSPGTSTVGWSCDRGQPFLDVCVNQVSPEGVTRFVKAFGGNGPEWVTGVTADGRINVYVTGQTASLDYPTTPGVLQPTRPNPVASFVTKLSTITPEVQFAVRAYSVAEDGGKVTVQVERTGNLSPPVSVDYGTTDGTAKATSDYTAAHGTLTFAPSETTKTIDILITDDVYGPEGAESFTLTLSNPTGIGAVGANSQATVSITDDDQADGPNPVTLSGFDSEFFVRQHYHDFLNREADAAGLAFWKGQLDACGADSVCLDERRVNVSAAFFLSIEFQETGYFVYRMYKTAYGAAGAPVPSFMTLSDFLADTQRVGRGFVVNQGNWQQQLDFNKASLVSDFVRRQLFTGLYQPGISAADFVDALNANAGFVLDPTERNELIAFLGPPPSDPGRRATVLLRVTEDANMKQQQFNRAFVTMEYFGYLRRKPNDPPDQDFSGWQFWYDKLNAFDGNYVRAEMVKAFLDSEEYRRRFGP